MKFFNTWSLFTESTALRGNEAMDTRVRPGHGYRQSLEIRAPRGVVRACTWSSANVVDRHDDGQDDDTSHHFV